MSSEEIIKNALTLTKLMNNAKFAFFRVLHGPIEFYQLDETGESLNFLYHKGNEYIAAEYVGRGFLLLLT